MRIRSFGHLLCAVLLTGLSGFGQAFPGTAGETLSGKRIVLADALRGHVSVLVAGFSREAGSKTSGWIKLLQADPAFAHVLIYQVAEIAAAPSFVHGMIRRGMKKGLTPAQQDLFVVLTEDEDKWRAFFHVTTDADPHVVLMDAQGKVLWHGHGTAQYLEPLVRAALH